MKLANLLVRPMIELVLVKKLHVGGNPLPLLRGSQLRGHVTPTGREGNGIRNHHTGNCRHHQGYEGYTPGTSHSSEVTKRASQFHDLGRFPGSPEVSRIAQSAAATASARAARGPTLQLRVRARFR